jgi:VWFA-related protein
VRWVLLLLACAAAAVSARQEARSPRPVRIDAIVTDTAGRPLGDLGAADFELRSGGVLQPIDHVELRRAAQPDAAGRVFALLLDEFHVSPGPNSEHVRRTALAFMDAHVRPADRVVVMKPLDSQLDIELTRDRSVWRRAIETFEGRAGDFAPRTAFEEQYLGRAPLVVETSRAQIVMSAMRALVTRLGEASRGRSAVAFVTEGFAPGGRSDRERRLPDFQSVSRLATRASVAVYTLNPAVAIAQEADAIAGRLRTLAADTGGEMGTGTEVPATLSRMSRDLDAYYVVTFTPSQPGEGRFHRFELTSKRRNAVVRAPSIFWTPVSPEVTARPEAPRPMRVLRRSPLIQSWYGVSRLVDGRMRLRVTWEPSPRRPAPGRRDPAAVVIHAAKPGGDALLEARVAAAELAEVVVPPGRVELDLTILAEDGTEIDRETRDIDVPEAGAPRVMGLPPEIIRARTQREFQAATVNPAAAPTPSREFRRSDRLIVRAAAQNTAADPLTVSARLLNRWGQPMRDLQMIDAPGSGLVQFSLPLAWLAPGEYEIELRTTQAGGVVSQKIPVKVIG